MNFNHSDTSRPVAGETGHVATSHDNPINKPDISIYSYSVVQAQEAFKNEGLSITERTLQRYCHSGKLRSIRINPDTRQVTTDNFFVFMIDPSSIPERIAQLREKQDFINPTVSRPVAGETGHVATDPDMSQHDETIKEEDIEDRPATDPDSVVTLRTKISELEAENTKLKIEKQVSDRMYDVMSKDRAQMIEDFQRVGERMHEMGKEIGKLEAKIDLTLPARNDHKQHEDDRSNNNAA